jgi:hypothetical protein
LTGGNAGTWEEVLDAARRAAATPPEDGWDAETVKLHVRDFNVLADELRVERKQRAEVLHACKMERAEYDAACDEHKALVALVEKQAKDDGLWFVAPTAPEAYLQQELRRLHAAIERAEDTDSLKERAAQFLVAEDTDGGSK